MGGRGQIKESFPEEVSFTPGLETAIVLFARSAVSARQFYWPHPGPLSIHRLLAIDGPEAPDGLTHTPGWGD